MATALSTRQRFLDASKIWPGSPGHETIDLAVLSPLQALLRPSALSMRRSIRT